MFNVLLSFVITMVLSYSVCAVVVCYIRYVYTCSCLLRISLVSSSCHVLLQCNAIVNLLVYVCLNFACRSQIK